MHKDVQELWESGVDVEALENRTTYLVDDKGKRWRFKSSYLNPVGVKIIVLESF
jgi:hypothetical protein